MHAARCPMACLREAVLPQQIQLILRPESRRQSARAVNDARVRASLYQVFSFDCRAGPADGGRAAPPPFRANCKQDALPPRVTHWGARSKSFRSDRLPYRLSRRRVRLRSAGKRGERCGASHLTENSRSTIGLPQLMQSAEYRDAVTPRLGRGRGRITRQQTARGARPWGQVPCPADQPRPPGALFGQRRPRGAALRASPRRRPPPAPPPRALLTARAFRFAKGVCTSWPRHHRLSHAAAALSPLEHL